MGVYAEHGLEYHLVLRDTGKHVVVIKQSETNERLVESKLFNADDWFSDIYKRCWCVPVSTDMIELSREEGVLLDAAFKEHTGNIASHGWYDVNTTTTTINEI